MMFCLPANAHISVNCISQNEVLPHISGHWWYVKLCCYLMELDLPTWKGICNLCFSEASFLIPPHPFRFFYKMMKQTGLDRFGILWSKSPSIVLLQCFGKNLCHFVFPSVELLCNLSFIFLLSFKCFSFVF